MHAEQEMAAIEVLQGEHRELERNRPLGKFDLDLDTSTGTVTKIIVRFDMTLDGTLEVTAMQPASGRSKRLKINNALSQFQADRRTDAAKRLESLFSESDELAPTEYLREDATYESDSAESSDGSAHEDKFPEVVALIRKAEAKKNQVESQDAEDIESLSDRLRAAMEAEDANTVATLCGELDDVLFYVQ